MVGPYDRIDMWLDRHLPEWNTSSKPLNSRGISQFALSLLWFFVASGLALFFSLLLFGSIHVDFRNTHLRLVAWIARSLAIFGSALAVFTFGYVVHSGKIWLRAGRNSEPESRDPKHPLTHDTSLPRAAGR